MKLKVVYTSGKQEELAVNDQIFGATPNADLLAQALYIYQNNQRQGTSKVKTRSEINRTKKKWFKQKGTGNARHGARTPNIFVGGGVAHGPKGTTTWASSLTKSQKRKALIYALSDRAQTTFVAPELSSFSAKTKDAAKFFSTFDKEVEKKKVLIVLEKTLPEVLRSTDNIENVLVTQAARVNVYELLSADTIYMTEAAVKTLEEKLAEQKEVKAEKAVKTEKKTVEKKVATKKPAAKKPAVKKAAKKSEEK